MNDNKKNIMIAGAGITGLVLAYTLSRDGHDVVLIEKEDRVGGLARSYAYDGFVFDIGPHRFHSDLPEVNSLIHEVLDDDHRMITRKSGVQMFGSYFDWPLGLSSVFKLPIQQIVPIALDLFRRQSRNSGNFEDYIISKYGQTLYEIFFKPYTEKFLRMSCPDISRDWAITGIDRAVIDKKAQFDDLFSLAKTLLESKPDTRFIYPESGGMQAFCDIVRERIIQNGGRVLTNSTIERVERNGTSVTGVSVQGVEYRCDDLVWTAPINEILSLLDEPRADLNYLSLVLYNYRLNRGPQVDYQWCYFGSSEIPFNRVSIPSLFNPALAPEGKSGVCAEVTCMKGDDFWETPEKVEAAIRKELCSSGAIKDAGDIIGYNIEKVANAYPIYSLGYKSVLNNNLQKLGRYLNLKLLGRTGAFWYNNMDHSIEAALGFHKELTGGQAGFALNIPDRHPLFETDVPGYQSPHPWPCPAMPAV
jgi:protoporphyrinogen oxidase